jgi:hypothetical protein
MSGNISPHCFVSQIIRRNARMVLGLTGHFSTDSLSENNRDTRPLAPDPLAIQIL